MKRNPDDSDRTDSTDSTTDTDRRSLIKAAGAVAATGSLGALAGCSGGQQGSGNGESESTNGESESGSEGSGENSDSSSQESVTITYWAEIPTANPAAREWFPKAMRNFEETKNGKVNVDMQPLSSGNIRTKIRSAVSAGNVPDISIGGSLGTELMSGGVTIDHTTYAEESNYSDKTVDLCNVGATYRDKWFATGVDTTGPYMQALRPKFFKDIGIEDPKSELSTWTDVRRAYDEVKKQNPNVSAHEVTGAPNDLEVYWTEAHTAYQDGADPWIDVTDKGTYDDPYVKIGKEGRTDGMIKNNVDLANTYSSSQAAQRTDEEIPSLMFTDRVASFHYGIGGFQRYQQVDSNVTFGWDGDVYEKPMPKLDPNFGDEYGFDELSGKEGLPGGNASNVGGRMIFDDSDHQDQAWDLERYIKTNPDCIVPLSTKYYPRPPVWKPALEEVSNNHVSEMPQVYKAAVEALQEYPTNYFGTGSKWNIQQVDQIRWQDINQTISDAIAGKYDMNETPGAVRKNVMNTLSAN